MLSFSGPLKCLAKHVGVDCVRKAKPSDNCVCLCWLSYIQNDRADVISVWSFPPKNMQNLAEILS